LANCRNRELKQAHKNAKNFDLRDWVIDVPELNPANHCDNKRSFDRRNELLNFSGYGEPIEGKFVVGSREPKVPASAQFF
jgi:hypothetical protein